MTGQGFRWHPKARLFDGQGCEVLPVANGPAVIATRPSGPALAQAFAAGAFRIGGVGPAPALGFETLTAGSSGSPRRIARDPASWTASFAINAGLFGVGPGSVVAVLGRLDTSLALYGAIEALHLGASLHLLDAQRPDHQRSALATRHVSLIYASPAQLRALTAARGSSLPHMGHLIIGGSKLDPELRAALVNLAPNAVIHEFYGASETSFITLAGPDDPPGSVGRPYPGVGVQIRGPNGVLPDGAPGAVWVRSPYLFRGYAGDDPGAAQWDDGWLSVGDIGHLAQGCLYLAGRTGRMVTIADHNVFPEAIEALLMTLPGVAQAAVLPQPDAKRGTSLVAVLQGDAGQTAPILRALRQTLGTLIAPRRLIWRQDWPLLAAGKTDLAALAHALDRGLN